MLVIWGKGKGRIGFSVLLEMLSLLSFLLRFMDLKNKKMTKLRVWI
jgi:hypothetical protein